RHDDRAFLRAARAASARRLRSALLSVALLVAVTVLCVAAVFIAETKHARFDVTATRQHSLSPRTLALLEGLESPHELVVVANLSGVDRAARQRVTDLLDALRRGSGNLDTTLIDTSDPADRAAFESLPERMLALRQDEVVRGRAAIDAAVDAARATAGELGALAEALGAWPGMMQAAGAGQDVLDALGELAALARVRRDELTSVANAYPLAGEARVAGVELPDVQAAKGSLGVVLARAAESLDTISRAAARVREADLYIPLHEAAPGVRTRAEAARDGALRAEDALAQAPSVRLLDALRLLQSRDAAVLLSESDVLAISIESIIASPESRAAEVRFGAERAITAALASAGSDGGAPAVVLVHSQPAPILEPPAPGQPDPVGGMRGVLDHLSAQGYDIREWAAAAGQSGQPRPTLGDRPVAWVVLPGAASSADGAARMGLLSEAVQGLLEEGESVLMNVGPSLLPRVGEPDPYVAHLAKLGLSVDTGRPLVETTSTPAGPRSIARFRTLDANDAHPLGAAIEGVALTLIWPTPMTVASEPAMPWTPIVTIDSSEGVWGESQWPSLMQAGAMNAAASFDERVDARGGPWTVVAAGERFVEGADGSQRVVVVGSNGWFFDLIALQGGETGGRVGLRSPGNLELLDASLLWLLGRDEVIASGADSSSATRIGAIDQGTLRWLWALCILGPATAVLLAGGALRLLRG
ncbi:MAG: hypothetical protein ACTS27_11575, partial [Phycisphaerales bacterium]